MDVRDRIKLIEELAEMDHDTVEAKLEFLAGRYESEGSQELVSAVRAALDRLRRRKRVIRQAQGIKGRR